MFGLFLISLGTITFFGFWAVLLAIKLDKKEKEIYHLKTQVHSLENKILYFN